MPEDVNGASKAPYHRKNISDYGSSKQSQGHLALIKLEDLLNEQRESPHPDFVHITSHKDQVLAYYQPIFSARHIPGLTKAEFESFLLFRNNNHWDSLHRVGKYMTEDMGLLRAALATLVEESRPNPINTVCGTTPRMQA